MTTIRFGRDFGVIEVPRGTTLLAAAGRAGAPLGNACLARGVCRACAVLVTSGADHLLPAEPLEQRFGLEHGWRMGCQARVAGEGEVRIWTAHWGGDPTDSVDATEPAGDP